MVKPPGLEPTPTEASTWCIPPKRRTCRERKSSTAGVSPEISNKFSVICDTSPCSSLCPTLFSPPSTTGSFSVGGSRGVVSGLLGDSHILAPSTFSSTCTLKPLSLDPVLYTSQPLSSSTAVQDLNGCAHGLCDGEESPNDSETEDGEHHLEGILRESISTAGAAKSERRAGAANESVATLIAAIEERAQSSSKTLLQKVLKGSAVENVEKLMFQSLRQNQASKRGTGGLRCNRVARVASFRVRLRHRWRAARRGQP